MPRAEKKSKTHASTTIQPWSCVHQDGKSQIEAYVMGTGKREIIAEAFPTSDNTAESIAEFIVHAVNEFEKREQLIDAMQSALEICLECEGLTWAAEHDADIVLRRANSRTGQ
jgi:lysine/ornithine N-monooxygenase